MPRYPVLTTGVLLATVTQLMTASAETARPELPRTSCSHRTTDIKGDAAPRYFGADGTQPMIPNNPALDILAVNLRLTPDQLQVFLSIDHIPDASAMAPYEASYRYIVTFKFAGKTFTYGTELRNTNEPGQTLQPLDGSSYPTMNMGTGGKDLPGSTADIWPAAAPNPSWVVFTSPRDRIEKNLGGTALIPGDTFTDIYAQTQVWTSQQSGHGDETSVPPAQATYVVGDDYCFGPPPTTVGSLAAPRVQWSDLATLSAVLLDENGQPLAGKQLAFQLDDGKDSTLTAITDASGRASVRYGSVVVPAARYPLSVRFGGDSGAGPSSMTGTLEVSPEAVSFDSLLVTKPSATTRLITARLLDDDKTAVAGARVDWWINGKRVAGNLTDKTGRAQLRTAKPGQTVQARFLGSPGTLAAALSKATRV